MAITRRQFLKRTGIATAGTLLGPGIFGNPFVRQALANIGDKFLVVLFLDGGNDGLNTVVPYDNGGPATGLRSVYMQARDNLRLETGQLSVPSLAFTDPNTGAQLGFHPGLSDLTALYNLGKVAVVQGCGYPDYNLSHDESRIIWQTANPLGIGSYTGTGWIGRHLALEYGSSDIPAVALFDNAPEFRTTGTSMLQAGLLEDLGFPHEYVYSQYADVAARETAFQALYAGAKTSLQPILHQVGSSGIATYDAIQDYPPLADLYEADRPTWAANNGTSPYHVPGDNSNRIRSVARDLREIAKVIYGMSQPGATVNSRFFHLTNSGYDTHADQGAADTNGQQYVLHKEVGHAIKAFYDDLADMGGGLEDKVCIVVWSEFSRRIGENDSAGGGTDHGSQGPMFVIGGSVNGGVYGNHPDIDAAYSEGSSDPQQFDGNTRYSQAPGGFRSTDFRDVYGTVLKHWLGMTEASILANVLPLDGGSASDYWTSQDFDLGFV